RRTSADAIHESLREANYYREDEELSKLKVITDKKLQVKIDEHMKKHHNYPPLFISKEAGYSSIHIPDALEITLNPAMLKKTSVVVSKKRSRAAAVDNSEMPLVERAMGAPKLPVSCLAASEHVIAMGNRVSHFVSDTEPAEKKHVVYQLLVRIHSSLKSVALEKKSLLEAFTRFDPLLDPGDISIRYNRLPSLFIIEVSTQTGDILKMVKGIKSIKNAQIVNIDLSSIRLNEGICLIKGDASNPIHALVNIGDSESDKIFLERDAGSTTGKHTEHYQDDRWLFNVYSSLDDLRKEAGYSSQSYSCRLFLRPHAKDSLDEESKDKAHSLRATRTPTRP
ncbi:MAG: hypothetical protein ACOYKA_07315, partial [Legionellaceae bacterium]